MTGTARSLLAGFTTLQVLLALTASPGPAWRVATALVLSCAAAGAVALRLAVPAPALAAACTAAVAPALLVLPPGAPLTAAGWPIGAWTFIALALAVRGRTGAAWLLMATMAGVAAIWSTAATGGPLAGVLLIGRPAATLAIGCLFALALNRTARRAAALQAEERRRAVEQAPARAAERERRAAARSVLELAGAALARVAAGPVAVHERPALLVLEGRLRDGITARPLLSDDLNAAAAAVRGRGDDVVLLVDTGLAAVDEVRRVEAARFLAEHLRASSGAFTGRVTVRDGLLRVSAHSAAGSAVQELAPR